MAALNWQWQLDEHEADRDIHDPQYRKLLLPAVVASLLLHVTLAGLLVSGLDVAIPPPVATVVKIDFVPSNPLLPVTVAEPAVPEEPAPTPEALPEPVVIMPTERVEAEPSVPQPEREQTSPPPVEVAVEPGATTQSAPEPARIAVPSIDILRQTIQSVTAESDRRSWLYECNVLEEDSGVRQCAPQSDRDFSVAERNRHYDALNPVRSVSARVRSASTIAGNSDVIADALNNAEVSPQLAGYVREQLDAEISEQTNNGTRSLQHMQRMVDRSDAALQAERVLGDGWARSRAAELARRRVQAN